MECRCIVFLFYENAQKKIIKHAFKIVLDYNSRYLFILFFWKLFEMIEFRISSFALLIFLTLKLNTSCFSKDFVFLRTRVFSSYMSLKTEDLNVVFQDLNFLSGSKKLPTKHITSPYRLKISKNKWKENHFFAIYKNRK